MARAHPREVARLNQLLIEVRSEQDDQRRRFRANQPETVSSERRARLKSLGYVDED